MLPNENNCFRRRVEKFVDSVTFFVREEKDKNELIDEVVRLMLKIQKGTGSVLICKIAFQLNILEEFKYFKVNYLDVSSYIHRCLWIEVVKFLKNKTQHESAVVRSDVEFMVSRLNQSDIEKLMNITINESLSIDSIDFTTLMIGQNKKRSIQDHAKSKIYTLRFLAENDPGLSMEDFEQDLVCEFFRVANQYPRSKCKNVERSGDDDLETRIQKYTETALNYKIDNIKEFFSCDSRKRVIASDSHLYKQKAKIKRLIKNSDNCESLLKELAEIETKIRTSNADYMSVVSPLVSQSDSEYRILDVTDETTTEESGQTYYAEDNSLICDNQTKMWIDQICNRVDKPYADFVRIVVGETHEDFDKWVKLHDMPIATFESLVKSARKFCNISKKQLEDNGVLLEILEDARAM